MNDNLSYIEISKKNAIENVKSFRNFLGSNKKIVAVVKSNAYGHGDIEMVQILNNYVDYFQINSIEEFDRIYKISKKPIFIFGYLNSVGIKKALKNKAIISIFDIEHLMIANKIAKSLKIKANVHIAVDSFLGREGFVPGDIKKLVQDFTKFKNINIDGVYSHFANIEDTMNFTHSNKQIEVYNNCVKIFHENGFTNIKKHISATSGILVHEKEKNKNDLVRLGVGLYGMWPSEHLQFLNKKNINLKPILKWASHIAQVKTLPSNHPVGYGLTYITHKKTKIAVIPQGYADGLTRSMSNNGHFLINGKIAKILGRVSMNMTVVDVSNIKNVKTGDEVLIIGQQGKLKITAEQIACDIKTINYEVTTKINPQLPRIIK